MLSFIYRLIHHFEKEHGIHPNLLYLNQAHMQALREQLRSSTLLDEIVTLLGMEIIISQEIVHPHVVWTPLVAPRIAV